MARAQGDRTDEEKLAYKIRKVELEQDLKKLTETQNLVSAQYNKVKVSESGILLLQINKCLFCSTTFSNCC